MLRRPHRGGVLLRPKDRCSRIVARDACRRYHLRCLSRYGVVLRRNWGGGGGGQGIGWGRYLFGLTRYLRNLRRYRRTLPAACQRFRCVCNTVQRFPPHGTVPKSCKTFPVPENPSKLCVFPWHPAMRKFVCLLYAAVRMVWLICFFAASTRPLVYLSNVIHQREIVVGEAENSGKVRHPHGSRRSRGGGDISADVPGV